MGKVHSICRWVAAVCLIALFISGGAGAQEWRSDSLGSDSMLTEEPAIEYTTQIDGEYAPPEPPVISNSAAPDAKQWAQATSDAVYNTYRNELEKPVSTDEPGWIKLLIKIINFLSSPLGKFLLWSVFILIVGYIIYRIAKGYGNSLFSKRDRRSPGALGDGALSEQSLLAADWEAHMREALEAGDSRGAIRYSYLWLLQLLQNGGFINYRPEKTNTDYYRELADRQVLRQPFRAVTRQYEWAWYGQVVPEGAALDSYLHTFQQLKQSLGSA